MTLPPLTELCLAVGLTILVLVALFRRYGQLERAGERRDVLTALHMSAARDLMRKGRPAEAD